MVNTTKVLHKIDENRLLRDIAVLVQRLCSFGKTLESEINITP